MENWTDDLMEVITDWMRVHDIAVDEDAVEELRDDINDTLEMLMLRKMSAMMGGRI